MRTISIGFILSFFLISCTSQEEKVEDNLRENINVEAEIKLENKNLVDLANNLNGYWYSANYIKNIEKYKSIYLSRKYDTKIQGFHLNKKYLRSGSGDLKGFTGHEGGYDSPISYDKQKNKFVNDISRLSKYDFFKDPFELNYDGQNMIEMYFPKAKSSDKYKRVPVDIQSELRKILIAGKYKAIYDNSKVKFDSDGKVHNFKGFKYYELVNDFVEGIDYDAILFFKSRDGGNWSVAEIYKFEIISTTLRLQEVKTDWDNFNHIVGDEILVFQLD
jgi:hypothetical protein